MRLWILNRPRARVSLLSLVIGAALSVLLAAAASAAPTGRDISINYVAANPATYDHITGVGGQYNQGGNSDVTKSLTGFRCGDIVVFFDAITVSAGASAGSSLIQLVNSYNRFTTSGGAVGFFSINSVTLASSDPGYSANRNETLSFVDNSTSTQTVVTTTISGVDPGERIILRQEVMIVCSVDPATVTGNIQTALVSAQVLTAGGGKINTGNQTVALKKVS